MFFREILNLMQMNLTETEKNIKIHDVNNEIFDMVNSKDQLKIYLSDIINSG